MFAGTRFLEWLFQVFILGRPSVNFEHLTTLTMPTKFLVTFKRDSGNRGSKQFMPAGSSVEVLANSSATPHTSEVKRAVEEKLGTNFNYDCSPSIWEAKKI
jgi:hypothetical protein